MITEHRFRIIYVTGFAKALHSHKFDFTTWTNHNFKSIYDICNLEILHHFYIDALYKTQVTFCLTPKISCA